MIISKDKSLYDMFIYLDNKLKENLINIYGFGTYFNKEISEFKNSDIDIIAVVRTFDQGELNLESLKWSNSCYEKKEFNNKEIMIIYNLYNVFLMKRSSRNNI